MTSRERVKRSLHFQGVDHIPHCLPDGKENDIAWLWIPKEPDRQIWTVEADGFERRIDAWGTIWTRPAGETNHGEKTGLAIPDVTRQAECAFPGHNNPRHLEAAQTAITANSAAIVRGAHPALDRSQQPAANSSPGLGLLRALRRRRLSHGHSA